MNRLLTLSLALILLTSIYYAQNPLPIVDLVYVRNALFQVSLMPKAK